MGTSRQMGAMPTEASKGEKKKGNRADKKKKIKKKMANSAMWSNWPRLQEKQMCSTETYQQHWQSTARKQ